MRTVFGGLALLLIGCSGTPKPLRSQLEVRQIQTRITDATDTRMVLKAMLNVLQDEGFIVKSADTDLGLLTGSKGVDVEKKGQGFVRWVFDIETWEKTCLVDVTVNVSPSRGRTRVRVNFETRVLDNTGAITRICPVDDPLHYEQFFARVDKSIFLQRELE